MINLFDKRIFEAVKWFGWIFLIVLLLVRGCSTPEPQIITIPEKKGSFDAVKPKQKEIKILPINKELANNDKLEIERLKKLYNFSQDDISELIAENDKIHEWAMGLNDSLYNEINKLTKLVEFQQTFNDDNLNATVSGIARGEVHRLKLDYTIKEQKIEVPKPKETFFRILAGGEVGADKSLENLTYKLNLDLQNRKGNLYGISYQKINEQDYFLVGISVPVINIKR